MVIQAIQYILMTNEDLRKDISKLKREAQLSNSQLRELNTQKEARYKEKEVLDEKLKSLISTANELKEQKQKLNATVKALKSKRDTANAEVKGLLDALQQTKKDRRETLRKDNVPSVNEIRERIRRLEFIIQTQAIKFDKEKQYMSEIRALRAKEQEVADIEQNFRSITELKRTLDAKRVAADELHKKIQDTAVIVTQLFDQLTAKSKEIIDVKEQRNTLRAALRTAKLNIAVLNKQLNAVLGGLSKLARKSTAELAAKDSQFIQEKSKEVKEKFKKKQKLTTADILILQREAMNTPPAVQQEQDAGRSNA